MGRIGRLLFRRLIVLPEIELVAVNDIMDQENLVYLLKYDSVYGHAPFAIESGSSLTANGKSVKIFSEPNPLSLPWADLDVDIVLECTGRFTSQALASQHLQAGAKKVLLSTTGTPEIPLMIYGFNQHILPATAEIISPGGCMTNCSTHILYLLNTIGIQSVQLNVIHSYTSRQELVDAPHKDFRRGRAAAESIIPVPVDLFESLERLFPQLTGKITTTTTRVPVANGAFADFSFQLRDSTTAEKVNNILKKSAAASYKNIIQYTEDALVSLDVKGNPHSAVIDGSLTTVVGNHVKVFAFFDNEYGYTSRMIDWIFYWSDIKSML
jgi:glyceraldehyde 3-phosphate dehydrogenase